MSAEQRLRTNLSSNRCGAAAVEFAIIGGFLATFFLGAVEIAGLIEKDRRVMRVAATIGDLSARSDTLGEDGLDEIFHAARLVVAPLDPKGLRMRLSSVIEDGGSATVAWSVQCNWEEELSPGSEVSLPSAIVPSAGNSVLMAQIEMDVPSTYGAVVETEVTLSDTAFYTPREVSVVPLIPLDLGDGYVCPFES